MEKERLSRQEILLIVYLMLMAIFALATVWLKIKYVLFK